jgi:hypothetical protein
LEAQILLERARLRRLQGAREEALGIADRCDYRLQQADVHNFLARFSLDEAQSAVGRKQRHEILSLAREYVERGKERALSGGNRYYKPALDEAERLLTEIQRLEHAASRGCAKCGAPQFIWGAKG